MVQTIPLSVVVAQVYNAKHFGAVGDGQNHPVSSVLPSLTSLAQLVAYNGGQYSFLNTFPFGKLCHIRTSLATASTGTTLSFKHSTTTIASSGQSNTPSGSFRVHLADLTGVRRGDTITGVAGITDGTRVERVNDYGGFVWLSAATTQALTTGTAITFLASGFANLSTGTGWEVHIGPGNNGITYSGTISSINTSTGVVTITPALNLNVAQKHYVAFRRPYSDAEALALNIDGLAIQAAIETVKSTTSNYGGQVFIPAGVYKTSTPIIIPPSTQDILDTGRTTVQVDLVGEGYGLAEIRPDSDFGIHLAALSLGDPTASKDRFVGRMALSQTSSFFEGVFRNFSLFGPATYTLDQGKGFTGCLMDGIKWGARRAMEYVRVSFFYANINVVGDHARWCEVYSQQGFYSVYLDDQSQALGGDLVFDHVFMTGSRMAGLGISKNASLSGVINKPYFGGQPYHIYGEPGVGDSYGQPYAGTYAPMIVQGTHFNDAQHEYVGNGWVVDGNNCDNLHALSGFPSGKQCQRDICGIWSGGYFSSSSTYAIPNMINKYGFDGGTGYGFSLLDISSNCFASQPSGMTALLSFSFLGYNGPVLAFSGDWDTIFTSYLQPSSIDFLANKSGQDDAAHAYVSGGGQRTITFKTRYWEGCVEAIQSPATVLPRGTVVESYSLGQARIATSTAAGPLSVVMLGWTSIPSGPPTWKFCVVALKGIVPVLWTSGQANNNNGQYVKIGTTAGSVVPATGKTDGNCVGWARSNNGGSNNTPFVELR